MLKISGGSFGNMNKILIIVGEKWFTMDDYRFGVDETRNRSFSFWG
jgi:phage major head subunit gpT-like protein